jgi:glycosyltransferase involved in cell wall biosynthesis
MFIRTSRLQLGNFVINDAKRLFQQYRPKADIEIAPSNVREGSANERPRIAIFQAFWRLHSNTIYTAWLLAAAGYRVDVFLFKVDVSLIPLEMFGHSPDIFVHSYDPEYVRGKLSLQGSISVAAGAPAGSKHPLRRLWSRIGRTLRNFRDGFRLWTSSDAGLIPSAVLRATADVIGTGCYQALIGVEGGLVWAGKVARNHAPALIYHSHHLFTADQRSTLWLKRMKAAEEKYHARCWATIVQDPERGRVLLADNKISREMKMTFLPISRFGEAIGPMSRWLQSNLQLPETKVLVLCYGIIEESRFLTELIRTAQFFDENSLLVFHGWGWHLGEALKTVSRIDKKDKVRFSSHLVGLNEEGVVVGSAHVSLALYKDTRKNDQLTGFSSEKVALSLQCGVPIVAFEYPSYEHIAAEGCGVLVKDLADIPAAVRTIMADYAGYRSRAFAVFERHYRFETNFQGVLQALEELKPH